MTLYGALPQEDSLDDLQKALGDLSGIDIYHNHVLVAVYKRPEKTKSGLFLTPQTQREDEIQGHVGLIVKLGPQAFVPTGEWTFDPTLGEGSWVVFRPSDGWGIRIKGVMCRMLLDTSIKGRVSSPDLLWDAR